MEKFIVLLGLIFALAACGHGGESFSSQGDNNSSALSIASSQSVEYSELSDIASEVGNSEDVIVPMFIE